MKSILELMQVFQKCIKAADADSYLMHVRHFLQNIGMLNELRLYSVFGLKVHNIQEEAILNFLL